MLFRVKRILLRSSLSRILGILCCIRISLVKDMSDQQNTRPPNRNRALLPQGAQSQEPEQRRLMQAALVLLLTCLVFVLYRDRDFWFPDTAKDIAQQPLRGGPTALIPQGIDANTKAVDTKTRSRRLPLATNRKQAISGSAQQRDATPPGATVTRTVLPPLEVEVVAGNTHQTLHPPSNSLRIEVDESTGSEHSESSVNPQSTSDNLPVNAAERAPVSTGSSDVVASAVQPGYPMLARQMKVQGSVILRALIGRDGLIQDLHVVSGPPVLASAAEEAVKQWHFKPHYQGGEAVETQAKITVNFIISTN